MITDYYFVTAKDSQGTRVWQAIIDDDYAMVQGIGGTQIEARWAIYDLEQAGYQVTKTAFTTAILDAALEIK